MTTRRRLDNDALVTDLAELGEVFTDGIVNALGALDVSDLADASEYPVVGYWLETTETLLRMLLITPGRFIVYERIANTELIIAIPAGNLRRISETATAEGIALTIELEADRVLGTLGAPDNNGTQPILLTHAYYTAIADVERAAELRMFASACRRVLGM